MDTSETYWTKLIDSDGVVHKTGEETIDGLKTIKNIRTTIDSNERIFKETSLIVRNELYNRTVLDNYVYYAQVIFGDSTGNLIDPYTEESYGRMGAVESFANMNSDAPECGTQITAYNCTTDERGYTSIQVGFDSDNISYARCPSTSIDRTDGADIVTRNWIPKDTRIVHTTGNEDINGTKNFLTQVLITHNTSPYVDLHFTDYTSGTAPSGNRQAGIAAYDTANTQIGNFKMLFDTAKHSYATFTLADCSGSSSPQNLAIWISNEPGVSLHFNPVPNNAVKLGTANNRWSQLYAGTATINTSDERLKTSISSIPDDVLDAWANIEFIQYQFTDSFDKKGQSARLHSGLIAQRIESVFSNANLDISRYGLYCYDSWEARPEQLDSDGNVEIPETKAGDQYSLRYEEALCIEAAYQRRRASRAESRIANLEEEVSSLKSQISQLINSLK